MGQLVVLVPNQDGSLQSCVDYRRRNALSVKDSYPLPGMDDCLDTLGVAQYFTTLDCNSGYWHIPFARADREKTAFASFEGCLQWTRMPFALCNAPATFQTTLDILLTGYRWRSCFVYLDNVIIFSSTFDEHLRHARDILQVLKGAGLSLKLRKCTFFSNKVDYLGHVIRPGRLEVATKNTAAIAGLQPPIASLRPTLRAPQHLVTACFEKGNQRTSSRSQKIKRSLLRI